MSLSKSSINSQQNFTPPNSNNACIYEFEDFRLDAAHLMLYKNGTTIPLKPKVVETLVALIERPGEVISKNELMDRLWQDSFVEEGNLSQNIYLLRKTLGTCAGGQSLIETFWRRGYRFNGKVSQPSDVELLFATHTKTLVVTEEETIGNGEPERNGVSRVTHAPLDREFAYRGSMLSGEKKSLRAKVSMGAAFLTIGALLIFGTAILLRSVLRSDAADTVSSLDRASGAKMARLTPDLNVLSAAISPDARYVVYDLEEDAKHSLWIKDLSSGSSSRLMPPMDEPYFDVTLSGDGRYVYYNSAQRGFPNRTIFRVPSAGGTAEVIARDAVSPVTFSPDQQRIAFVRGRPGEASLIIANSDGSGDERILSRRNNTAGYESWGSNLSWSPDGARIAICGGRLINERYNYELIEVSTSDGQERIITAPGWEYLDDVQWLSDQSALMVRGRETHASPWQIVHVSYPGGEMRKITNDLNNYDGLSLSADSRSLVVTRRVGNWNLWLTQLDHPNRTKQITFGGAASDGAYGIAFAPNGKLIYTSPRDGNTDLWIINADGTGQGQLTKNAGEYNVGPSVTSDGRFIVFASSRSGTKQIWRMDIDGGNPEQLTSSGIADGPSLSADDAWVYFTLLDNDEKQRIAKVPVAGGEPQIVKHSASQFFAGLVSPNAELMEIGFYDGALQQPWKRGVMSMDSGEILRAFEGYRLPGVWTKDSKSIVIVRENELSNLWLQPIEGGQLRRLTNFENGQIRSFAVSPDFKQIAISRGNPSAEAVLITSF